MQPSNLRRLLARVGTRGLGLGLGSVRLAAERRRAALKKRQLQLSRLLRRRRHRTRQFITRRTASFDTRRNAGASGLVVVKGCVQLVHAAAQRQLLLQ